MLSVTNRYVTHVPIQFSMIRYFAIATLVVMASCGSKLQSNLLSPTRLSSFSIKVDANTDSTFHTPKGAIIKIEKGTFTGETALEIKEAYTIRDMFLAGL